MPSIDFGQYDLISNVLAQGANNPVSYPAFTGDEQSAYAAVCTLLGVSDLRKQYANLDFSPSAGQLTPQNYPANATFPLQAWNDVCNQLATEIGKVNNVRQLYANFAAFNLAVFVDEQATLDQIQTALEIENSAQMNLGPANFVEGVLYTIFSAMGPEASFLANVAATAWNAAVAAGQWNPSEQLQVDYESLLSSLLDGWNKVTAQAAGQETTILQDWGMTQAVSALCTGPLSVTSAQMQQAQSLGVAQFGTSVLQMMMPAICAITGTLFNEGTAPAQTSTTWVFQLPDGKWCELALVVQQYNKFFDTPVQASLMDDYVWAAGTQRQDVFFAQNGWLLPYGNITVTGWPGSPETDSDAALLAVFFNSAPVPLSVRAVNTPGYTDQQVLLGGVEQVAPGAFGLFCAAYSDGPSLDCSVWAGNYASSVASCTVSQSVGAWKGGSVSISNANWVFGYKLSSQTINGTWGTGPNGAPGLAIVNIEYAAGS